MPSHDDPTVFRLARADVSLASVRYRGLAPALALQDRGRTVAISASSLPDIRSVRQAVVVKPLAEAEAAWAERCRDSGIPTVVDLCDNVFVDGYGGRGADAARRFAAVASGCTVTVPTAALRDEVLRHCDVAPERVLLVPDVVETAPLVERQLRLLGRGPRRIDQVRRRAGTLLQQARRTLRRRPVLLWFGNHGAAWGRFGLADLELFADALAAASRRHRAVLWIVSNHRGEYERLRGRLGIETRYFDWSHGVLDRLLAGADICLVPNSLDPFARTKSANRAVKALAARVPVVATRTRACAELQDAVWLDDPVEGIEAYLGDAALVRGHLRHAHALIARDFSMAALGAAMERACTIAGRPA